MIVAEPSLHLREIPRIGEVRLKDIDRDSSVPAQAVRERLHSCAVARH